MSSLFFKQKTAYELRISDWSSDVCSSDLIGAGLVAGIAAPAIAAAQQHEPLPRLDEVGNHMLTFIGNYLGSHGNLDDEIPAACSSAVLASAWRAAARLEMRGIAEIDKGIQPFDRFKDDIAALRSERHKSELQSLMRISYAVFCLNKKK